MLAIARALYHHSTIISLDEPTASLTTKETEALFEVVRKLKKQGVTILYVSHRLEEIFQICDRATIFEMENISRQWTLQVLQEMN